MNRILTLNLCVVLFIVAAAIIPFCSYTVNNIDKKIYSEIENLSAIKTLDSNIVALEQDLSQFKNTDGGVVVTFRGKQANDVKFPVYATLDRMLGGLYHLKNLTVQIEGRNIQVNYPSTIELKRLFIHSMMLLFILNCIFITGKRRSKALNPEVNIC